MTIRRPTGTAAAPSIRGMRTLAAAALGIALVAAPAAHAQRRPAASPGETRAERALAGVRDSMPLLMAFLRDMPKGGDLHSHLSGAVYAESYLTWAAEAGLCADTASRLSAPPCAAPKSVPVVLAMRDTALERRLVNAWSMEGWDSATVSGHDQFFNTFGRFGMATWGRTGDMLAEVTSRAAAGHVSYLELMQTPDGSAVGNLGRSVGWDSTSPRDPDFGALREKLLAAGLRDTLEVARANLDTAEARRAAVQGCATAGDAGPCGVTIRWLYQVARARPPEQVFAQILAGFELASTDPRVVGLNLVQPEDAAVAVRDFSLQMRMIAFLRPLYPGVKVTLHAGELVPGLVAPEALRFHIRESVQVAGAERIGHGVDVLGEERAAELMREMAARGVMVEIALTSNDVILGVRGPAHPLGAYRRAGVPVALATDDEGVSRSEMTQEYAKAVTEQELGYVALKDMARTSLEHAFIQGASVWRDAVSFTPVDACAPAGGGWDGAGCRALVAVSPKAALQRRLEADFAAFEQSRGTAAPAPVRD
jgi:adenosine deaminase